MITYGIKDAARVAFYKKSDGKLAAYFPFGNSLKSYPLLKSSMVE